MTVASILIVEDNPVALCNLTEYLKEDGYHIRQATNAPEALGILRGGYTPTVMVSDIVMPGAIDGIELARIVRQSYPSIGILLMTGWSYSDDHNFPVLTKPFSLSEVSSWVVNFTLQSQNSGISRIG